MDKLEKPTQKARKLDDEYAVEYFAFTMSRTWEKVPQAPPTGRYRVEVFKRQRHKK